MAGSAMQAADTAPDVFLYVAAISGVSRFLASIHPSNGALGNVVCFSCFSSSVLERRVRGKETKRK
jgi:hypothetical protein